MPPETRKLITFANCSNPSSSFFNVKVSVYTGIIPCFIPSKDNPELNRLLYNTVFTYLDWNVWETTYVNVFIAWMQATSKVCC